jgi:hypothetical protein
MILRTRSVRVLTFSISSFFAILFISYISLLIAQTVSARRMSKTLDALEAIRIGDPASSLEKAVPQCPLSQTEKEYSCGMLAVGAWYWQGFSHIPSEYYLPIVWRFRRLGIQPWYVSVDASVRDGQIRNLRLFVFFVAGRKSLGEEWELNASMPQRFIEESNTMTDQSRTFIGGYSITSLPGGTGIRIAVTPGSEPKELQARHINQACLRSFNGCEELCQLLPDVTSVLHDRGWHWADCAPRVSER